MAVIGGLAIGGLVMIISAGLAFKEKTGTYQMNKIGDTALQNKANELTVGLLLTGLDDGKSVGLACKGERKKKHMNE